MIKNSINKILWHVVRFECLVGIEILKCEFWPFLQQTEKKSFNGHNFRIRHRKNAFYIPKKLEKKPSSISPGFTRSAILRFSIFQNKKSYFKQTIFSYKIKKIQKNKKIQKKDTEMYNKEDCWIFWIFLKCFDFFDFFEFFGFFWIFGFLWRTSYMRHRNAQFCGAWAWCATECHISVAHQPHAP